MYSNSINDLYNALHEILVEDRVARGWPLWCAIVDVDTL
jgi:hypothetical protein